MSIDIEEIKDYLDTKKKLDTYKAREMKMRQILAKKVKEECEKKGIEKVKNKYSLVVDGEYELKLSETTNVNFDADYLDCVYDDLEPEIKECFAPSWKLVNSKYKALKEQLEEDEEDSDLFAIVTEKPGAPKFEVKELDVD